MTARQIAHASGGLGSWARYRSDAPLDIDSIGPSRADLHQLGIVGKGSWLSFGRVVDLDEFEYATDVCVDANGNVGVVERPVRDGRIARTLIDTYLLGDARVSAAADQAIEERARAR